MRKRIAFLLVLVFLTASCIIKPLPAKAESRTIVVPDDYSTIQDAINAANEGDTIFVRKGVYEGAENQALIINKTLSLKGENAENTKINLHPLWHEAFVMGQSIGWVWYNAIQVSANDVVISGFTIESDGGEIWVTGNKTQITDNIINTDLTLDGSQQTASGNNLTNSGIGCYGSYASVFANNVWGGYLGAGGASIYNLIYGNIIQDGDGIGIASVGTIVAKNIIANCRRGIEILWGGDNIICGNVILNSRGSGLSKVEGQNNTFFANLVANNSIGVMLGAKAQMQGYNALYRNNFINNTKQVEIGFLDHADKWDNGKEGNYWSDYNGTDADGDGIGDMPYVMFGYGYREVDPFDITVWDNITIQGDDSSHFYETIWDNYSDRYPLTVPFDIDGVKVPLPEWVAEEVVHSNLPMSFPTALVLTVSGASIAVVCFGMLVYFKKRKH
jgi:nitrous oxidase accessory protein